MKAYFYDSDNRYIGNRDLIENELMPSHSTTTDVMLSDGQQAHFINEKWVKSEIPVQEIISTEPIKSIEQQIAEMAEQLINAQEALDFLIMGGM